MRNLLFLIFICVFTLGCGTQRGSIFSKKYSIDRDLLDSTIVTVMESEDIEILYSPFEENNFVAPNEFMVRIHSIKDSQLNFVLSFITVGYVQPKSSEVLLLTGSWSGELLKQAGNMTYKEKKLAIEIFKRRVIKPLDSYININNLK